MKVLLRFGYEQAMSCLFPVCIFAVLALTKWISVPWIARYDFILLCCLGVQIAMLWSGMETKDELKVICAFHLIGLGLELYKVHMGSWSYPEEAWSKLFGVPLYSGFMYASVASYMCQAWRRLQLRITGWPLDGLAITLGTAVYLNFFTHHFLYDFRWVLKVLLVIVFFRTFVHFTVGAKVYRMPLVLSFVLIGFFIWVAENVATFFGAWSYPNQANQWTIVHWGKISSWSLLVIISFIIVAQLKRVKEKRSEKGDFKGRAEQSGVSFF